MLLTLNTMPKFFHCIVQHQLPCSDGAVVTEKLINYNFL